MPAGGGLAAASPGGGGLATATPGGGGMAAGYGPGAGGGGMPPMGGMGAGAKKPRFRPLLVGNSCSKGNIVTLKTFPRVPLNPKYWPYHVDESDKS